MKRPFLAYLLATAVACGQNKPAPVAEGKSPAEDCWTSRKHGQADAAKACFDRMTRSADPYLRAEGQWGLGQFKDAKDSFEEAIKRNPKSPRARVRFGRLLLERYNPEQASELFDEALEIDEKYAPALLGAALVGAQGYDAKAAELADKALASDPKLTEAQELKAVLALEDANQPKAIEEADKAIAMGEDALDAMAVRAAVELLADRSPQTWLDRMAKVNPKYSNGYGLIAHLMDINRRYDEEVEYYRKALAMEPTNDAVRSKLGIQLMRMGQEDESRKHLEEAYENGWKDNPTVNTLRLMDSYKNFVTIEGPKSVVRLHKKEADLLKLYVPAELDRAIATYEKKYKMTLKEKVHLEVYPDHEDFAVRTLGMPGIGALGVTFGHYVAIDSPSGRPPAQFHWASTMWHELSHVFVIAATNHRTPRWFTEGMAVHEETATNPDWGDRMSPPVIEAVKGKKLLPITELERGYTRPNYPNQVIVSYFQGGKTCDYINERWGYQKLLDMMNDFAGNHATAEVIERQLKMKPEEFDAAFLEWLDKQIGEQISGYADWQKRMKALATVVKDKGEDQVILTEAESLAKLFPDYVEKGSPYELAAGVHEKKGDRAKARTALEMWARQGGREPALLRKLATLQDEAGMAKEAAVTLEKLNMIYPVHDGPMHLHLGQLYGKLGNQRGVIREYSAVLAENPTDRATPHFELAKAHLSLGERARAEENLLDALESAPSYKPAQKLLLEMNSGKKENP